MKYLIVLLVCVFEYSCTTSKNINHGGNTKEEGLYKVKKIRKVGQWYAIYVTKGDSIYKVVTQKQVVADPKCEIRRGRYYKLNIHWSEENVWPRVSNYLDVPCTAYDGKTTICIEPKKKIYKLYYATNLRGLCYIKE